MTFPPPLRGCRAAFVFMTRIPVGGFPYRQEDWSWASAHFPFVGCVVGALGAGVLIFSQPFGGFLSACLTILSTILLTGAFHEDGLADTADALGGAHDPQRVHEILKDSRLGSYGVTALCFSILLRIASLAPHGATAALLLPWIHSLSRLGPVWLMRLLPYVSGSQAKSSALDDRARRSAQEKWPLRELVATLWIVLAASLAGLVGAPWGLLAAQLVICALATVWAGWSFHRRAGGWTGDFLGALQQICEIGCLLAAAWFL